MGLLVVGATVGFEGRRGEVGIFTSFGMIITLDIRFFQRIKGDFLSVAGGCSSIRLCDESDSLRTDHQI